MSSISDIILQVDDVIESTVVDAKGVEALQEIRTKLQSMVNPQAPLWGVWEYEQQRVDVSGVVDKMAHIVRMPSMADDKQYLEVTFYKGVTDGKPVIQIDGHGDFRINVNDAPIWDADPNGHSHEGCSCTQKEEL